MSFLGRVAVAGVIPLVTCSLSAGALAAQDTTQVRTDSITPQAPSDTLAPAAGTQDSAAAQDTVLQQLPPTIPVEPAAVPLGPLPPGSRYVFTRDSILWSRYQTLGELLGEIPGLYVIRSGWQGQPEYSQYAGRGGSVLEVYWDGMPYEPVGADSLFVDPQGIPLTYIRRIDVVVQPDKAKVFIVSERNETPKARSLIRVMSGRWSTAAYTAMFQKRWRSGVGLDLAANFRSTDGLNGLEKSDQFDLWAKLAWNPSDKIGATYQVIRQDYNRSAVAVDTSGIPALKGVRTDWLLGLWAGTREDGLGLRTDLGVSSTSWGPDSAQPVPDQTLRQAWLGVRYADVNWSAAVRGRVADQRTPGELTAALDWMPTSWLVLSGDGRLRSHEGGRSSARAHGSAGLIWGALWLVGEVSWQDAVQAPALAADTAITTLDYGARFGVDTRPVTGWVGVTRRDAFQALAYPQLPFIPELNPSDAATYVVADLIVRPFHWLSVSGWYSDPFSGAPADFQPPSHLRGQVTLRSKFWRTFRSGAFDLKVQGYLERWNTGTAGRDEDDELILLPPATFWGLHASIQLVSFNLFYNLRNAMRSESQIVPRLDYAKNAHLFGVTWTFSS